jgi:glutamate dehydrogenase/leucine dehydrogenase
MNRLYSMIETQLARGVAISKARLQTIARLEQPDHRHHAILTLPANGSDKEPRFYRAFRVQHNNILGPYKGGIRFHPAVDMEECTALSSWMTYKCALHNLKLGGGKGGISIDPRIHTSDELHELARQYVDVFGHHLGENIDIPAPDVGTGAALMDTMNHRLWEISGKIANFTGKSVGMGGSLGRTEATGLGVAYATELWCDANHRPMAGMTFAMQGFGNVGSYTAKYLAVQGMRLVCVSDHTGTIADPDGFDIEQLTDHVTQTGGIAGFAGIADSDPGNIFATRCDVLIPAALELQITSETVDMINAAVIIEAANGPVSCTAEHRLMERGIDVIPDIFANSGGVVVSNFEYIRNKDHLPENEAVPWDDYTSETITAIHTDMRHTMLNTFREMQRWRAADETASYRDVCYGIAIRNIELKCG